MFLNHRSMNGPELSARGLESCTGREPAEKFRHAMNAPVLHGRGEMMWAGHNVGNDFSIRGILDRGFEDADDSGRSIAEAAAEAKGFTDDGRIALESARPERISQDGDTSCFRAVVFRADEATEDGMEAHHVEIGAVNDAGANFPGLAEADHGETDGGELAEGAYGFDACAQVLNFRHGEWDAPGANARRALLDVNEPVFITVDKRPQQDPAHQTEDRGVRPDAQRQREHHGERQPFGALQRTDREPHVTQERQNGLEKSRILRLALGHGLLL